MYWGDVVKLKQAKSCSNADPSQPSKLVRSSVQRAVNRAVDHWLNEDWPPWAEKMATMMMQSVFTTLNPSTLATPRGIGGFCGYLLSLAFHVKSGKRVDVHMTTSVAAVLQREQILDVCRKMADAIVEQLGAILDLAKKNLNPTESREFHVGFSEAFKAECLDENGLPVRMPPNGRIYHVMFANWKKVETLQNRAEVHRWLCQELGESHVPSVEAVQQICKRFGVRLAGPGHPKK